ncbi:DUF5723 family protein [Flagellimonas baculiformis]|uniref:DUF5723 family protein n=1 Tax=Flagellimonas baculiformis TaxID=3067310 RepID=UPI00296ECCB2|nr:DUF5723 family protein [Muricauda sp. D6]
MFSKKILLGILLLSSVLRSQSYVGFLEDNYSGVHGIISNPASIADSKLKMDINLIGASSFFGNDYIGLDLVDAFSDFKNTFDTAETFPSTDNFLAWNLDIMGPSVMFSINDKQSLAIFTRGRGFFNLYDANGNLLEKEGGFDESEDFSIEEGDISGTLNAWTEIGASYALVLWNNGENFIKGGLSLKYLQSLGNVYIKGYDLTVDYNADNREVTTTGEILFTDTGALDNDGRAGDFYDFNGGNGIGADIGFIYEWRPDHVRYTKTNSDGKPIQDRRANKYVLKVGASVTDIGKITDSEGRQQRYDLNKTQDVDNFDGDVLDEALADNFNLISESRSSHYTLPTALHTNVDWNVHHKLYLNFNADISVTAKANINTAQIVNQYRLTPRYESTWFSIYSPFGLLEGGGFQWGTGLRLGPIYLGSGSVLSSLLSDNSKAVDLYAGVKIPVYQNKLKDKDADGLLDEEDGCPDVAGPIENNGCPWQDTDGDGVLDKDDECPSEVGPQENNGCPWPDTDRDGILDKDDNCPDTPGPSELHGCPDTDGDGIIDQNDRCPEIPGSIEHKGCPDSDGDTLVDIDDECPSIAGPVSNKGCPEVTQEVQKQLNDYAKTILFDTGKATIKTESVSVMVDIIQILNEYPNAKFTVEGHTDSVGSNDSNQKLSESRANSVRDFLINEGIAGNRLTAIGYGEEKPIASNATSAGKRQNRRVEINLIK